MNYKTIAVYLDNSVKNPQCLEFAIHLALKHNAHLRGIYAAHERPYLSHVDFSSYEMLETLKRQTEEAQQNSKRLFSAAARKACILFEWHALQDDVMECIKLHTCTADLAVVMQGNPDEKGGYSPKGLQELVLVGGGRPTLFLPHAGSLSTTFENIAIAWNGSRESARAVADAHPFLLQAKNVVVLVAETQKSNNSHNDLSDIAIRSYLSRHDIKAEIVRSNVDESDVGSWLLSATACDGADLLICGAYGHSRAYEMVWGGVTRALLRSMNTPILMSH